ncbi:MAG: hypothetical protein WDM76_07665 [Limisphaerales bacterium]
MSLAGLPSPSGVLVDAGIVMVENVVRHAEQAEKKKGSGSGAKRFFKSRSKRQGRSVARFSLRWSSSFSAFVPVFCVERTRRKIISPARLHENLCDDRLGDSGGDARACAVRNAHARAVSSRGK